MLVAAPETDQDLSRLLPMQQRVEAEITRLIHAQDPIALTTNFAIAPFIAWLHHGTVDASASRTWLLAWLLCNGIYLASFLQQRRNSAGRRDWARARSMHLFITNFVSILPAGFMPWVYSTTPETLYLNIALLVIYCSGVFASNTMLSFAAFAIGGATIIVPLVVLLLLQHTGVSTGIAVALAMYYLLMLPFSLTQSRSLRRAIQTGFENQALALELAAQTARAEQARREAEDAVRAKARFLAAATHDLRQPLHALSLTLASLRAENLAPTQAAQVMRADDCSRHLSGMFDSLLDHARLDAGTLVLEEAPIALASFFSQIETRFQPLAEARGLWLRARPTDAVVMADPTVLWRIVSNLMTNALNATSTGGILIAWREVPRRLEVRDSGRGIAREDQARIFEEFRRLPGSDQPAERGLGLGLSTVRRLAHLLGGDVTVRSRVAQGSTFSLCLPPFRCGVAYPDIASPSEPPSAAETESAGPIRLLAVDDDAAIRESLSRLLPQWGYDVRVAASAAAARVHIAADWQPQLLMLDRHLPDESGLVLGMRLRASLHPAPRCLIVTGDTAPDDLRAMQASGFSVLHKPVVAERLRAALLQLIRQDSLEARDQRRA